LIQLEHTCTNHPSLDAVLHLAAPTWKQITGGCHINRDTVALLRQQGWQLARHERHAAGLVRMIEATPPKGRTTNAER
jgi:hypothetical protein